ncbi:MAG TPA: hypothetical protein VIT93_05870 [Dehalococcoidia bacterium]
MAQLKTRKGFFSAGLLLMILVIALGTIAVGYGLWSKVLTIEGTVHTGSVAAVLSLEEIDQGDDAQPVEPLFWEGDSECDADSAANDDCEVEGKDIGDCTAQLLDGLPNPGPQPLEVTVVRAYPSFHCWVQFNVENTGSIPIRVHQPVIQNPNPNAVTVDVLPPGNHGPAADNDSVCYHDNTIHPFTGAAGPTDHPQLEPGEVAFCLLHIHVEQAADQNAEYSFTASVCTHQWNEEPSAAFPCGPSACGAVGVVDICVDGDGIATAGPGAFQIAVGDAVLPASAAGNPAGLDLIDRGVVDGVYQAGDDLMVEDPVGTPSCPTAARNAVYDNTVLPDGTVIADCVVLDPNGSLADSDQVTCDAGGGCGLWFRDDNGNGRYDVGEDLIVDVNGSGAFD